MDHTNLQFFALENGFLVPLLAAALVVDVATSRGKDATASPKWHCARQRTPPAVHRRTGVAAVHPQGAHATASLAGPEAGGGGASRGPSGGSPRPRRIGAPERRRPSATPGGGAPKGQRLLSRSPPATTGSGDTSRRWRMADGGGGACGARQQRGTAHGGAHRAGGPGVGLGSNRSPFNLYFIFIFTEAGQKAGPFWASGTGLGQQAARPSSRFLFLSVKRK